MAIILMKVNVIIWFIINRIRYKKIIIVIFGIMIT